MGRMQGRCLLLRLRRFTVGADVNHGNMTINDGVTITQNGKFSSLLENGWYNGAENKSGQPSVLTIKGGTFSGA